MFFFSRRRRHRVWLFVVGGVGGEGGMEGGGGRGRDRQAGESEVRIHRAAPFYVSLIRGILLLPRREILTLSKLPMLPKRPRIRLAPCPQTKSATLQGQG